MQTMAVHGVTADSRAQHATMIATEHKIPIVGGPRAVWRVVEIDLALLAKVVAVGTLNKTTVALIELLCKPV